MPVPYAPGTAWANANASLAALGTGATPSQAGSNYIATVSSANGSPIVLTGSNQSLANVAPTLGSTKKAVISGTVGITFTGVGEPPTDTLKVNLTVDGVPAFSPALGTDCTEGSATLSFTYETSLAAGTHSIHLEALMEDAGTPFTVAVGGAQLNVQIVST